MCGGGTFFLSRVLAAGQKRFDLWRIENTGSDYLGKKGMFEIKERTGAQKGPWGASSYECVWKWRATHREEIPGGLQRAMLMGKEEKWRNSVPLCPPCLFSFSFWKVRVADPRPRIPQEPTLSSLSNLRAWPQRRASGPFLLAWKLSCPLGIFYFILLTSFGPRLQGSWDQVCSLFKNFTLFDPNLPSCRPFSNSRKICFSLSSD